LAVGRPNITANLAIDPQATAESDIADQRSTGTNQTVNSPLGFAVLFTKHISNLLNSICRVKIKDSRSGSP
jgi:hypothetical protein